MAVAETHPAYRRSTRCKTRLKEMIVTNVAKLYVTVFIAVTRFT